MNRKKGVPIGSAWSWPDGSGTVRAGDSSQAGVAAAGGVGRGRGTRGGVVTRPEDGRGTPPGPKPLSTTGGALTAAVAERRRVRMDTRSEECVIVWGAGEPGEVGTDAIGLAGSTGSVPCTELWEGVGWTTDVVAAGASAEPSLTAMGAAKTGAKSLSAAHEAHPRPAELSTVAGGGCRNTRRRVSWKE